jgi:hypothetical protein
MKNIVKDLVNRFNTMVAEVAAMSVFASHVHYVDLRPLLPNDNTYKTWWANELHPKDRGFDAVADKYAQLLAGL